MDGWTPHGQRNRCYFFWKEFSYCLAQADKANESNCKLFKEDYLECLTMKQEANRHFRVYEEVRKKGSDGPTPPSFIFHT